ncbi:hypothetical protein L484_004939 [Morus notabilis]|uniref:Uncharacterized protein n=1 Tax=Morus notabilis TaxID=981085 RepID=W9S8C5_9ROSA|nr:hypothetical protein L484_004939 [Morus notabilis]
MATKPCFSKIHPKIVLAVDPTWIRIKEDTTTDNTENLNKVEEKEENGTQRRKKKLRNAEIGVPRLIGGEILTDGRLKTKMVRMKERIRGKQKGRREGSGWDLVA